MVAVEEERPGRALGVRRLGARGSAAPGLVPKNLNHGRVCGVPACDGHGHGFQASSVAESESSVAVT